MNYFFALIVPLIFLFSFAYALYKKVRVYDSFTGGMKEAVPLIVRIFPYIAAVTVLCTLMEKSATAIAKGNFLRCKVAKYTAPI